MKKNNLLFLDVETTGFDPIKNEIIEIGAVLVAQTDKGLEVLEEIDIKVKPERIEDADPQALRVNGYDEMQWIFASTLPEALKQLSTKSRDAIMVAHNVAFDYSFINHAFQKTGIENPMHYHKLDTISIAWAKLNMKTDIDAFSLKKLCEYFGIENQKAHTALSDARATFQVYKELMK
jgi:DNA polymerase-3 subunit epsilon